MRRLSALLFILFPAMLTPSCTTPAGSVCDAICECEHCSDQDEDLTCAQWETYEEMAIVYECETAWENFAACYEEKGACDETAARFSTEVWGSCSGSQDTSQPCSTNGDCQGYYGGICQGGTCHTSVCSDSNQECGSDSDCHTGEDRCEAELSDLANCVDAAADDPTVMDVD